MVIRIKIDTKPKGMEYTRAGSIVDVDDAEGARLCMLGFAVKEEKPEEASEEEEKPEEASEEEEKPEEALEEEEKTEEASEEEEKTEKKSEKKKK